MLNPAWVGQIPVCTSVKTDPEPNIPCTTLPFRHCSKQQQRKCPQEIFYETFQLFCPVAQWLRETFAKPQFFVDVSVAKVLRLSLLSWCYSGKYRLNTEWGLGGWQNICPSIIYFRQLVFGNDAIAGPGRCCYYLLWWKVIFWWYYISHNFSSLFCCVFAVVSTVVMYLK